MRAFVALPLPDAVADPLARRAGGAGVGRAVAADDLHLTLAFLDEQPEEVLADLDQELAQIRAPELTLAFGPPDFFGSDRSRVFALSVAASPDLLRLHERVRAAIRAVGMAIPPAPKFRPHVTLIRLPPRHDPAAAARLQALIGRGLTADLPGARISRMALVRSHLARGGAHYDEIGIYPLGRGLDGSAAPRQ